MARKICPVWIGYLLASPLRKLFQNPSKILGPYIKKQMVVMDIGCAMGFFSLPLAEMVGPNGKVICVDVQEGMLSALEKRAIKAGLLDRIDIRLCEQNALGLSSFVGTIDFALAAAVVHEVPDPFSFFLELYELIKSDGKCLLMEPKGHVSETDFAQTVSVAQKSGFSLVENPRIARNRAILLKK